MKPLHGKRILVTRPPQQAESFARRLRDLGAEPVLLPTIRILPPQDFAPLDRAIAELEAYDWIIFTSVNGVQFFWERLAQTDLGAEALSGLRIAAIGPATAEALADRGVGVDYVPQEYVAEAVVEGLPEPAGRRFLLPRADIARPALRDGLRERGARVDEIVAYRNVPAEGSTDALAELRRGEIDVATFTASSTVRNFAQMMDDLEPAEALAKTLVVCIGPITAGTARDLGIRVDAIAEAYTIDGLIAAIVEEVTEQ